VIGRSTLLAGAAVAVALALQISSGFYDPWAVLLVSLATAAAVFGAAFRRRDGNPVAAQALLGAGCAAGLGFHLFTSPTFSADVRAFQGGFRWFAMVSLVVLSAYLCIHLRASLIRARFLLLLACFAVMALVAIRAMPADGADIRRYGSLAALLGGAWLLARAIPGNAGELAAALLLFQPRTLFVLEQGGVEPLALFCFALALFFLGHRAPRAVAAVAVLAAIAVLFAGLAGPEAPSGGDPLSFAPFTARLAVRPTVSASAFALVAAAVLVLSLRRRQDVSAACCGAAAAWAVALLGNPGSFSGAWWLCSVFLAAASSLALPRLPATLARKPAEALATAAGAG
jgi:hypothetical protein